MIAFSQGNHLIQEMHLYLRSPFDINNCAIYCMLPVYNVSEVYVTSKSLVN